MRTLSSEKYGSFDEEIIKDNLKIQSSAYITGNQIVSFTDCEQRDYFLIMGRYSNGDFEVINKTLETGCVGEIGEGEFNYEITDGKGDLLKGSKFNPSLVFTDAPPATKPEDIIDGSVENYEGNFYLTIPVYKDAEMFTIKGGSESIAEIFLGDISARACMIK
jgi:hypothetical protein